MSDEFSVLVWGVACEAERVGMARASVSYYRSCCRAVARFCRDRGGESLTEQAVDEFLAVIDGRWGNGEISSSF